MADVLGADAPKRADALKHYLAENGRRRFVWGELDCFLFVADWVEQITRRDPASAYRGAYATSRYGRNIIKANGGVLQFAHDLLTRVGCEQTERPDVGDVALVRVALLARGKRAILVPTGAICSRVNMWAIKSRGASLTFGNLPVIRAWKVGHG
jgi:hypothetical protein